MPKSPVPTFEDFMRLFGNSDKNPRSEPELSKQQRLIKFLVAFTVARPSSLLDLPGMTIHMSGFSLDKEEEEMMVAYTKAFYNLVKGSGDTNQDETPADTMNMMLDGALAAATRAQQ